MAAVSIETIHKMSCTMYVRGSIRYVKSTKYYILPDTYTIIDGRGCVMIVNLGVNALKFNRGELLTRANIVDVNDVIEVNRLETLTLDPPTEQITDQMKTGNQIGPEDRSLLKLLLNKYRECFLLGCLIWDSLNWPK